MLTEKQTEDSNPNTSSGVNGNILGSRNSATRGCDSDPSFKCAVKSLPVGHLKLDAI